MAKTFDNKLVDIRTVDRYVERGSLDKEGFEKYLSELPDLSEAAAEVEAKLGEEEEEAEAGKQSQEGEAKGA